MPKPGVEGCEDEPVGLAEKRLACEGVNNRLLQLLDSAEGEFKVR